VKYPNFSQLYSLLLSALSVVPSSETNALAIKTVRAAISIPNIYDFQQLASLPCIQQFQNEKNPAYDFVQVFLTGDLETYRTFTESHPTWLADNRTIQDYPG
jgi:translation initiation factor 3 subunit M